MNPVIRTCTPPGPKGKSNRPSGVEQQLEIRAENTINKEQQQDMKGAAAAADEGDGTDTYICTATVVVVALLCVDWRKIGVPRE